MNCIVVVKPHKSGYFAEIEKRFAKRNMTLKEMQEIVGGYIEIVCPDELPKWARLVCNQEGKLKGLPRMWNCHIKEQPDAICGTFFVCAEGIVDGEPDLVPLTEEQEKVVMKCMAGGFSSWIDIEAGTQTKKEKEKQRALTLPEFMDGITGEICIEICKWRVTAEDDEDLERHCKDCPVNRLVG